MIRTADMFSGSKSFNQDLSKWNVAQVTGMLRMFAGATSFEQVLCGEAWVNSDALQEDMFTDSPGSIAKKKKRVFFSPDNRNDLKEALNACLRRV